MRLNLYQEWESSQGVSFFLDKVLHERYQISEKIIQRPDLKIIFLIRQPDRTLSSLVEMGHRGKLKNLRNPENALAYYQSRLHSLTRYAELMEKEYLVVDSNEIIDKTDIFLKSLSAWLGLPIPLSEHYAQFKHTGHYGSGDTSTWIRSGVIKDTRRHQNIEIPSEIIQQAEGCFRSCKEILLSNCHATTITAST
ncbi:MAG: hypothetical protein AAF171_07685 [Cyanobacteria bacterium P01_A01_bin.116]